MTKALLRVSDWRVARIVAIAPLTPRVTSVILAPDAPIAFRAGQHVDVRLTAPDGYQARRSYSIASSPETPDRIELAIERLDGGEVSPFFHEAAEVGDAIEIRGPIGGHFVWETSDGGPLLLIGAGSGVAPLMAMVRHRAARRDRTPALLLCAARTSVDVLFREELLALDAAGDGFDLMLALSRQPVFRPRDRGRRIDAAMIEDALERLPAPPAVSFVCGSNAFVTAATEGLAAARASPASIRTERYGG